MKYSCLMRNFYRLLCVSEEASLVIIRWNSRSVGLEVSYFFVSCWHWKSSFWPYRVKRPHMVLIKARCRSWWSGWTSRCRKRCCFSEVQDPRVLHCTCVTDLTAKAWVVSRFLFHRLPLAEALLWFGFPAANRHWSVLEVVLELNLPSKFHVFHCVSKLNFCFYSL